MLDVPEDLLQLLVCSKCDQVLSRGPVFQQHNGAAVCGLCQTREDAQPASRNSMYEATAQLLRFPCRYQEYGCPVTVPYVPADSQQPTHEDTCDYRLYVCPVLGSNNCDWAGRRSQLQQHCEQEHPERVLSNPVTLTPDIRRTQSTNYVIPAFHLLFLLHTRVCLTTAKMHYAVRLFAEPQKARGYIFTITIQRGDDIISRSKEVLGQELLALQEHTALNLSTNSVLSVLGGWEDVSLSVKISERSQGAELKQASQGTQTEPELKEVSPESQTDSELELDRLRHLLKAGRERCARCDKRTRRLYKDKRGWLCVLCAPDRTTCPNKGCNFQDFGGKVRKHSMWFCFKNTECHLCTEQLQPGTVIEHTLSCPNLVRIKEGSRFLIRRKPAAFLGNTFLVETSVASMFCSTFYGADKFELELRAPKSCEELYQLRCKVRLECAGVTRTFYPHVEYDKWYDWSVTLENRNFLSKRNLFIVVEVTR